MDQEVEHVIPLPADLQTSFNPVQFCRLEELRCFQLTEEILLRHRLLRPRSEFIENKALEKFLI